MSGHHSFEILRAQMTPERRARNTAKTQALLADLPQQALQHAREQSQAELVQRMHVPPPEVATIAHHTEMYVRVLRHCIEALGGTLEIVAHFPDGSVTITHFAEAETP
jgi:argininosuccinate lyase